MEEIFSSGAVIFKERGSKTSWFIIRPGKEDEWQLPKGLVRHGESSVRAILRTVGESGGIYGSVLEEVGRMTTTTTRNGAPLNKRIIYYLLQQKGKSDSSSYAKTQWAEFSAARSRLATLTEKRILAQAHVVLAEWRKQIRVPV